VPWAHRARWAIKVSLAHKALRASKDRLDRQAALEVTRGPKARRARLVHKAPLDCVEPQAFAVQPARMVLKERKGRRERPAVWVHKAPKVAMERKAWLERKEYRDRRGSRVPLAQQAHKEPQERRESQEHRVRRDHKGRLV
jgi:hypothetical protein